MLAGIILIGGGACLVKSKYEAETSAEDYNQLLDLRLPITSFLVQYTLALSGFRYHIKKMYCVSDLVWLGS